MKTSISCSCFLLAGIVASVAISDVRGQTAHEDLLKQAESRLRAIYDRDEFRAKQFRADWLPDSSGYTVLESAPDAKEQVRVRYDVASGKRTVLDAAAAREAPPIRQPFSGWHERRVLRTGESIRARSEQRPEDSADEERPRRPGVEQSGGLESRRQVDRLRAIGRIRRETPVGAGSGRSVVSGSQRSPVRPGGRGHPDAACGRGGCPGKGDPLASHSHPGGRLLSRAGGLGWKLA